MRANSLSVAVALLVAQGACSSREPATGSSAAAASSGQGPSAGQTPSADPSAATSPAAPGQAAADYAPLPRGAALYASVRTPFLDDLMPYTPQPEALRRDLEALVGRSGPVADALAKHGVAKDRPLLVAVVPADLERSRKAIDSVMGGGTVATPDTEPALAVLARFVVPLPPIDGKADMSKILDAAAKQLDGAVVVKCPGKPACDAIGGAGLIGVVRSDKMLVAVRVSGASAQIDLAYPIFAKADHPSVALALEAFASAPAGGPEASRCSRLDPSAGASLCVDADRAAALGTTMGWGNTVKALQGTDIDASFRKKILETGHKESLRNLELAAPKRRLLDDGTLSFFADPAGPRVAASWALTDASRAGIEKAFSQERCGSGAALLTDVLRPLSTAFGDPGPDFARPEERLVHVQEAGFGGYAILFARTWPNFLPSAVSEIEKAWTQTPDGGKNCVRAVGGRLEAGGVVSKP